MPATVIVVAAGDKIDLSGGWTKFWAQFSGSASSMWSFLTIVGAVIVVMAVITHLWQKHRSGGMGQGRGTLMWGIIIGALFAGPNLVIPIILKVIDLFANAAATALSSFTS